MKNMNIWMPYTLAESLAKSVVEDIANYPWEEVGVKCWAKHILLGRLYDEGIIIIGSVYDPYVTVTKGIPDPNFMKCTYEMRVPWQAESFLKEAYVWVAGHTDLLWSSTLAKACETAGDYNYTDYKVLWSSSCQGSRGA